MDTRNLFRQIFCTVLSFLYINGDSEYGLNGDGNGNRDFDFMGLPPAQSHRKLPFNRNMFNVMSPSWTYSSGPGQNVLIPPMTPMMKGGLIGPPLGVNAMEGIVNKTPPIQNTVRAGLALPKTIMAAGSWKGLPPPTIGAVPMSVGQSFLQISNYGYEGKVAPQVMPKPISKQMSVISVPIPGTVPDFMKQQEVLTEPIHGLPINHLYVHIPMVPVVKGAIGGDLSAQINPLTSDMIIVIDNSPNFGQINAGGVILWNPLVVEFLTKFIDEVPLGPGGNRIGIVLVSFGIDDLIPLTFDKALLLESLNKLRPSFSGGCSGKGIGVASNIFFQYGRPTAIKRVIYLNDGSPLCSYTSMAEVKYARKCGIDIVNVIIGQPVLPSIGQVPTKPQWLITEKASFKLIWKMLIERMFKGPVHGGWSQWSAWNQCSMLKACDIGYQHRFRVCDNPKPMYGGVTCPGFPVETRMCYPQICIDTTIGHWTRWTDWTACSSPCGIGSQTRSRNCLTLTGQFSPTCRGKYVEIQDCLVKECPVPGGWSDWSVWSYCSVTCGIGVKMRARQCNNPVPKFGGKTCEGLAFEEVVCEAKTPCPIDGGFGPWSEFGPCNVLCGSGEQIRSRECNNPVPQFGGHKCEGFFVEKRICETGINCPIDGGWGKWGEYSFCSVTCGAGVQIRERFCDSPVPLYGGAQCQGPALEEVVCEAPIKCPIDGHWSIWTEFGPCIGLCGEGTITRTRVCDNPYPMYGGKDCVGSSADIKVCDTGKQCPIDGGWGLWSVWSKCPVKCGTGIVARHRECNSPVPQFGGAFCVGLSIEEKICDTKISCPINGKWSAWFPWSFCSVSCGVGKRQRHRLCNSPPPQFGGSSCEGLPLEEELCDTQIPCPIHGGWGEWILVEPCNVKCGMGQGKRIRECNNPPPQFGGADCVGPNIEVFECDTKIPCPIHGGWGHWGLWSLCPVKCGEGFIYRTRKCDNPFPMFGGLPCKGPDTEEKICKTGIPCAVDGHWSFWTSWSMCSASCGGGFSARERICNNPAPMYGGRPCQGPDLEKIPCNADIPCPVHGGWSEWVLSACSVTCGKGVLIKTRFCNSPAPVFGGMPCEGPDTLEAFCETGVPCPIHGGWGRWSEFSVCSASCGIGTMERIRVCDSPAPMFGGDMCVGESIQVTSCITGKFCPIHGGWSMWTPFTPCSKTCGVGIQRRTRTCTEPMPQYGGADCEGHALEEKECNTNTFCPTDGQWGQWSWWGICSVTCGVGFQQRTRLCNNPAPLYGGGNCLGSPIQERECDTQKFCPIHGGWGQWSEYSLCSVSCGIGFKVRIRKCDSPVPQYGGLGCFGPFEDKIECDFKTPCPINGHWSSWFEWEPCSVVCGEGVHRRYRKCNNPAPMYGGAMCLGKDFEQRVCVTGIHCPIHGQWGPWGEYNACSATCGMGFTQRYRICDNPTPMYGGEPCFGENTQTIDCDAGIPCPIDGGFSQWSKWSICDAKCGQGIRTRTRLCNSPVPMYGGADCLGPLYEEEICFADVYCPVEGFWSLWSSWSKCSVNCGMGVQERDRVCNNPAPMYGGMDCVGERVDVRACDTTIRCPIDGGWSLWAVWSGCSVTCGVGKQIRSRSCTNPKPQFGGEPCIGMDLQEQLCFKGINCPQDGGWGFWSDWGQCGATCGKGFYSRFRMCDNPPPTYGGRPCEGPDTETLPCDSGISCAVDGQWSVWGEWSFCSVSCGTGIQRRIRSCSNPAPNYGGNDCFGDFEDIRDCTVDTFCPIDGSWSIWGEYSLCTVTCGVGVQVRMRLCNNPPPQHGGLFCEGPDTEKSPCKPGVFCPVNGNWGPWSIYSECSASCGSGVQTRTRTCTNPAPQYGGELCFGNNAEDIVCNTNIDCPIDGGWTMWGEWGFCVAECGFGYQERTRYCTNPIPSNGGRKCQGPGIEKVECDSTIRCPIHGGWGAWYEWGYCSASCGFGVKERIRECNNPTPQFGGQYCVGNEIETLKCDSGVICAVDGQWSEWSAWTVCDAPCGISSKTRERQCNNPPPQFEGLDCFGGWKETVDCDTGIECAIDGQWSLWGEWEMCSAMCGKGTYRRHRKCDSPSPQYGGADCAGPSFEEGVCDTLIPCPISGGWSFWSEWSLCSVECGIGYQIRTRTCTNPSPLYGGLQCKGPREEKLECDSGRFCPIHGNWGLWSEFSVCEGTCGMGFQFRLRQCDGPAPVYGGLPCEGPDKETTECKLDIPCPVDGGWSLWSIWSICRGKCAMGTRERSRSCENPPSQFGGAYCSGPQTETEPCDTGVPCTIDGGWGVWTEWSSCVGKCGKGFSTRVRYCDSPRPQNGGLDCEGISEEAVECDMGFPCAVDGGWTLWTKWSACIGKCGIGLTRRVRECSNPVPQHGGKPCRGPTEDFMECDTLIACPIDGYWSQWSEYSYCSVTCGVGTKTRFRTCSAPPPQFGGRPCEGQSEQSIGCDTQVTCAIDGQWSSWYKWSFCSVTCGTGERERYRECNNPVPAHGGTDCFGNKVEIETCDTGVFCPIHGFWADWSGWSSCVGYCGDGVQTRFRECSNPAPAFGGETCIGDRQETSQCYTGIPCAVDGNWGQWSDFSKCDAHCGTGYMDRRRACDSPAPQHGGRDCQGPTIDKKQCDTLKPCVVHGGWSFWSEWGFCSATCGFGERTRYRTCTNPSPLYGGMFCKGVSEEIDKCDSGVHCPIHGQWSIWLEWSFCSAKCGYGRRERRRECNSPIPQYGGLPCEGPIHEIEDCYAGIPCPVDGQWSAWGEFGKCSASCGTGTKTRIRYCDNPAPKYNGKKCPGPAEDIVNCDSGFYCAVDGGWSAWGDFSLCSVTCDSGFKIRKRICNSPTPQNGGRDCVGPSVENLECFTGINCPVDGGFTFWSSWSLCSASCGFGFQVRTRTCTNPLPKYGGRQCVGPLEEYIDCDAGQLCPVDGQWSFWSEWTACDKTCGFGRQYRFRTCDNPKPLRGGRSCDGYAEEWKDCFAGIECSTDGGWSLWGEWGSCQETCGTGLQYRSRTCTEPRPTFGGAECIGNSEEFRKCETGIPCVVVIDGNWSIWGRWSTCSSTCGEGIQSRRRFCDNPAPLNGGLNCVGLVEETKTCFSDKKCSVDGGWSEWVFWSRCSASCGEGFQIRVRYCTNPSPSYGGKNCQGNGEEKRTCFADKQCGIDGGWSLWSLWSKCSVSCGNGIETRTRYCNNPSPMLGGKDCQGVSEETRTCYSGGQCVIDGGWSMWEMWSICSVSCGQGFKIRFRYCNNPSPRYGGKNCQGIAEEKLLCYGDGICTIDGGWSWWTKWSACDTTCGHGTRTRQRFCDNPIPQNGGKPCSGPETENMPCLDNPPCVGVWSAWLPWQRCDCNTGLQERIRMCEGQTTCEGPSKMDRSCDPVWYLENCPQGEWQLWGHWSSCAGSCGQGVRERVRDCIDAKSGAISMACKGLHTETEPCQLPPCMHSDWGLWAAWSSCSVTCGQGVRERTRLCVDPKTGAESSGCLGLNMEFVNCEKLPCPTQELNCSTECVWDNGIGYAVYPGDCSMFVQCDSLYGHPLVQQCSWGLLWSLDALQCTFPHMSECDKCSKIREGEKRSYYATCRSYWTCPNGVPIPSCCKRGFRFDHKIKDCVIDEAGICNDDCPPVEKKYESKCEFRPSNLGPQWYEQAIGQVWTPRPCPDGTQYIHEICQCAYRGSDGTLPQMPDCLPDLHLTFNSLAQDLKRNDGIHVENVKYLGDGTAYFDGTSVINSNVFSNAEWGRTVYVYIRFKPEGSGRRQGLIHNSGCGPSDIGPSVFIGLDRVGKDLDMKFSTVPQTQGVNYEFVNITTPDNRFIDAWFKFGHGHFQAEVNGITAVLDLPGGSSISRRHGALNIGGNLCRIGNEAFGGFIGIVDEVKIYKCKPPI